MKGAALWARHAFACAFALLAVFNLALAPLSHAAARETASVEQVASDLRATFGDAVQLCVNAGDDGAQPGAPAHHGHDCPLCCLHSVVALATPDALGLPMRRNAAAAAFVARNFAPPPPARASPAQPRAPPALS